MPTRPSRSVLRWMSVVRNSEIREVGIAGMSKFKEIQLKMYGWIGNRIRDTCIISQVLYHWAIHADIHGPSNPNYHIPFPLYKVFSIPSGLILLNTNAWTGKVTTPNVVGMGGLNKYKEVEMKIYDWTWNQTRDHCITSQVLYHWAIQADIHDPSSPNHHTV